MNTALRDDRGRLRGRRSLTAVTLGTTALALFAAASPAQAAGAAVESGSLDWGIRSSFRSYISGPIAHGTISASEGATQHSSNGTFVFGSASGTVDAAASSAQIAFTGKAGFTGHEGQLDLQISSPSVSVSGGSGTVSAKIVSKSLSTGVTTDFGTIPFVTFSVGAGSSFGANTVINGTAGKLTGQGVTAFSDFYTPPSNDFVDDFTISAALTSTPVPATPTVTVSKTTVSSEGETVTVTGTGFAPGAALGTRPPLQGKPAGVYVAFGTFLNNWRPSAGAPASARKTAAQGTSVRWAVPEADRATVGQDTSVTLNPDGSFTANLFVQKDFAGALEAGNYGIYTYPGSGATAASYETYTPLSFAEPVVPVSGQQTITTTVLDNLGLSIKVDNSSVTLPSPTLSADGQFLEASGAINPVQVTDLRGTDPGWNLSGQVSSFVSGDSTVPASALGWSPNLISKDSSQAITSGAAVSPNAGSGLSVASPLASAAAGHGRGKASVGAGLSLQLPVLTAPGVYTATLTLTAI